MKINCPDAFECLVEVIFDNLKPGESAWGITPLGRVYAVGKAMPFPAVVYLSKIQGWSDNED